MYHLEDQKVKLFSRQQKIRLVTEYFQNETSLKRRSFAEDNHVNYKTFCDWIQAWREGKLQQDNNQAAESSFIHEITSCSDALQAFLTIPDVLSKKDDLMAWVRSAEQILKVCNREAFIGVEESFQGLENDPTFPSSCTNTHVPYSLSGVPENSGNRKRSFSEKCDSFEPLKRPCHDENLVMNGQFMNLPVILSPFLSSSPALLHFFTYVHNPWLLNLPQEEQREQLQKYSHQLLLMILVQNKVASEGLRVNVAPEDVFLSTHSNKTLLPSPTCISWIPDGEMWPLCSSSSVEQSSQEEESEDDELLFSSEKE